MSKGKRKQDNYMKENDIRPDNFIAKQKELYKIDQLNILKNKNQFIDICCPACDDNEKTFIFQKDGFSFVECNKCKTLFVNPRPSKESLFEHYNNSLSEKFWNDYIYPKSEEVRTQKIITPRIERLVKSISKYQIHMNTLIDIGAGFGTFCHQIKRKTSFKRVIAVEPDHVLATSCKKKGIETLESFFEEINIQNLKADVITSFEIIEHVFSPKEFLSTISQYMKHNALLYFTTPNIKGFDMLVLQDKSDNITAPDHLNYFHPESISTLLKSYGFDVLEISTPGQLDTDIVRKKVDSGILSLENNPFLKSLFVEKNKSLPSFQNWLKDNLLSSHMSVFARKAAQK